MENRLPIGSVVLLKGGKKRIMIIGFYCNSEDDNKLYDYCGLLYPEGYLRPNELLLFDNDNIEKVFYLGLNDNENKEFQNKLTKLLKEQK